MATPPKTDAPHLLRRLSSILATQMVHLRKHQREQGGELTDDQLRQVKICADALTDKIKLERALNEDLLKALGRLSERQVEALANLADSSLKGPNAPASVKTDPA